jgi:beta-lactamase regulating signal transducer with metallopeptidase domain
MMIAGVVLAAYTLINMASSVFVAILWRTRAVAPSNLPPAVRARRLLCLRAVPTAASIVVTLGIVTPAFALFEPFGMKETMGPVLLILAAAAIAQVAVALLTAVRSIVVTARIERDWLSTSTPLAVATPMPAFAIETGSPIIALVGVWTPKLLAARSVVEACSAEEIACIAGHERGHLQSRDNVKRWVMSSLPDLLRCAPIHDEIVEAWHHAAEDAADDAATGKDPVARAELAALLLKVARLAPHPLWRSAIVSPFVERDGLERRVRRLIQPELEPPPPLAIVPLVAVSVMTIAAIAALSSPAAMEFIFDAFESLVSLGR